MNKEIRKAIRDAFKRTDLTVRFGNGWVNVARPDGVHCEFYPCLSDADAEFDYLTGTYELDGEQVEIDLCVPDQVDEFVAVCQKLLTF